MLGLFLIFQFNSTCSVLLKIIDDVLEAIRILQPIYIYIYCIVTALSFLDKIKLKIIYITKMYKDFTVY